MTSHAIKQEGSAFGQHLTVKDGSNSRGASPSTMSEDDVYEDAGDLEFPETDNDVYLMKLPGFLWQRWAHVGDDEEIDLGTVRVAPGQSGGDQKLTLKLANHLVNKELPREYDMIITNAASKNTFIFTEKDIPSSASKVKNEARDTPPPLRMSQAGPERIGGQNSLDKSKKYHPYVRKAAPKKTAIAGVVKHEVNCNPVENAEFAQFVLAKAKLAALPKRTTKMLSDNDAARSNALQSGVISNDDKGFNSFVKTNQPSKNKNPDLKTARIAQNDLLDMIFECFSRYKYWSMKALKAELKQPEPYLKSTLEQIAELVRSGTYNMQWTLKPENENRRYMAADDGAKVTDTEGPSDEDEDEVEMEDVVPG